MLAILRFVSRFFSSFSANYLIVIPMNIVMKTDPEFVNDVCRIVGGQNGNKVGLFFLTVNANQLGSGSQTLALFPSVGPVFVISHVPIKSNKFVTVTSVLIMIRWAMTFGHICGPWGSPIASNSLFTNVSVLRSATVDIVPMTSAGKQSYAAFKTPKIVWFCKEEP